MTDHDPRSRAWINMLQGPDHSRGEHHLNYWIANDNERELHMEAGWRSGSSRSSNIRGLGSDSDPTMDARSRTREMDHDPSWVCNAWLCGHINVWTRNWCGPHIAIHYPSDPLRSDPLRSDPPPEYLMWTTLCKR